jgi:nitrate reductase NapD
MTAHVASLIVRARPELADAVAERITTLPGVEVHANEHGKIIVVLEAASERALADQMESLREQPDVLMVSLVFHQVDPETGTELS